MRPPWTSRRGKSSGSSRSDPRTHRPSWLALDRRGDSRQSSRHESPTGRRRTDRRPTRTHGASLRSERPWEECPEGNRSFRAYSRPHEGAFLRLLRPHVVAVCCPTGGAVSAPSLDGARHGASRTLPPRASTSATPSTAATDRPLGPARSGMWERGAWWPAGPLHRSRYPKSATSISPGASVAVASPHICCRG